MTEQWKTDRRSNGPDDWTSIISESGHVIADVYSEPALGLIANAPQILAALQWALPRIDCSHLNPAGEAAYRAAESALAAATLTEPTP